MTQQTAQVTAFDGAIDLTDPAVMTELVDLAHGEVNDWCGEGAWDRFTTDEKVSNTASAIAEHVHARSSADPLDVARVLVDCGHMDPVDFVPSVLPAPEPTSVAVTKPASVARTEFPLPASSNPVVKAVNTDDDADDHVKAPAVTAAKSPTRKNRYFLASEIPDQDLTNPTTAEILVDHAHKYLARKGTNWAGQDRAAQLELIAKGILPVLGCQSWQAAVVKRTAKALLDGNHITPPASVPTGPATSKPAKVRVSAKARALSRTKRRRGFTCLPETLLEAVERDAAVQGFGAKDGTAKAPARLLHWHVRVLAELINATGEGRTGGEATRTTKQIAEAIGHDQQSIRKLLVPNGLMSPWAQSATRKHQVCAVGKFVKLASWWLDDLAMNPCSPADMRLTSEGRMVQVMSGPALEDATITAVLTVQRRGDWDSEGADSWQKSTAELATMAGVSVRTMGYGLAEAKRRGWMTSVGEGGYSMKARRRVHTVPPVKIP